MTRTVIGMVGEKYGKLTVVSLDRREGKKNRWICSCECGGEARVVRHNLLGGRTKSCGCNRVEFSKNQHTHQMTRTTEYRTWRHIKSRCFNPNVPSYKDYGARGISMCDEWINSFEQFYKDMGLKPTKDHSIDRIDNEKGYNPENCRWATRAEQSRNKRCNIFISYAGKRQMLIDWAKDTGINHMCLYKRYRMGWSDERIVTTPSKAAL